ncbi:hypothetical protein HPB50_016819 [Hyalomma asiaticum]|uniref:Uncharacterized protein n=1 Tax=Hyalomma asiaticum TaxID=266040 RepID=A0ACB7TQA2_HYAAI|nr:hypothetical protein HPB50_016819 [Hyalomma asiaticum]
MGLLKYPLEGGHVDKDLSRKTASDQEVRLQRKQRIRPVLAALPESFVPTMQDFLMSIGNLVARTPCLRGNTFNGSDELSNEGSDLPLFPIVTGRPLYHRKSLIAAAIGNFCSNLRIHGMAPTNGQSQVNRPVMPRTDQVMSVINREGMVVLQAVRGGVLFCTVGISMRHVQYNLRKPSHVIIDGVHERHVCTDLHLPVHGEPLAVNSTTKVILMSGTINTMLSKNFGGDPVLKIPGRTHPVALSFSGGTHIRPCDQIKSVEICPYDRVKAGPDVLTYVMVFKPPGAILCFLPGWNEIDKIRPEASLRQRECHVADLRPGKSYHLFTQGDLRSWNQFKRPEMRKIDLRKVVTLQDFFARPY